MLLTISGHGDEEKNVKNLFRFKCLKRLTFTGECWIKGLHMYDNTKQRSLLL